MNINPSFTKALARNMAALHAAVGLHLALPPGLLPIGVAAGAGLLTYIGVGRFLGKDPAAATVAKGYSAPVALTVALRLFFANPPTPAAATDEAVRFLGAVLSETPAALHMVAAGLACAAVAAAPNPFHHPR